MLLTDVTAPSLFLAYPCAFRGGKGGIILQDEGPVYPGHSL